jgi:hypothetical protein
MSRKKCLNCGETVLEKYCSHCGQKTDTKRLNWHHLIHDIPHSIFHLEKGFFLTLKMMIINPGLVIREYLDGKRAKYFRPLTYLFILGTIAGLIYLNTPIYLEMAKNAESAEMAKVIQDLVGKYYNIVSVVLIPFYSFSVWLFYKRERNFVEIVTAHFLIMGTVSVLALLNLLYNISTDKGLIMGLGFMSTIASLAYYVYVYSTAFVSRKPTARLLIGITLVILNNLITIVIIILVAIIYVLNFTNRENVNIDFSL